MKKFLIAAAVAVFGTAATADAVYGTWKTQPDDNGNYGLVEIAQCETHICGTLGQGFDSAGNPIASPNIGRLLIWEMSPTGTGRYVNGTIWAPDRDAEYRSEMVLEGDQLTVTGIHWTGIRRSQVWTRTE